MKAAEVKARREAAERALQMFNAKVIQRRNFGRQLTVAFPNTMAIQGPVYLRGMQGLSVTLVRCENDGTTTFEVDLTRKPGAPPAPTAAEPGVAETHMVGAITRTRTP